MSNSAINTQVAQLKIGNVQNQADNSAVYSGGIWSLKNSTALTSVTITDAGNVGIGTASPSAKLEVNATGVGSVVYPIMASNQDTSATGTGAGISFVVDGVNDVVGGQIASVRTGSAYHQSALTFQTRDSNGAGLTERMRIDASGRLLVGATSPLQPSGNDNIAKLQVTGHITSTAGYVSRAGSGGATANLFNIYWTGSAQLWIDTTNVGTITLTSDYRIKKNVETQELPALERITQLRPVRYEYTDYKELYKADGVQREGFIAHELQAVIPSAVEGKKDDENQIQSLKLDALCSVMVKAIQELSAKVDAQAEEIKALKAQP